MPLHSDTLTWFRVNQSFTPLYCGFSGRFGALKSDSVHHFFRNACTNHHVSRWELEMPSGQIGYYRVRIHEVLPRTMVGAVWECHDDCTFKTTYICIWIWKNYSYVTEYLCHKWPRIFSVCRYHTKNYKRTINDQQNITQTTKDRAPQTPLKTREAVRAYLTLHLFLSSQKAIKFVPT
jgi:hypothetical protein